MNRRQKEILKHSLEEENRILHRLSDAYEGAAEDIQKKIEKLLRSVPKLQSRIYQARFQKALRSNIDDVLNKLRNGIYKTLSDFLDSSYEDGFIASIYDMQGQGVPLIFPVDPDQMYRAVTLNSRLSKGLYTKLGFDINVLKKEIREELSRGIAAGKMIDNLAKTIDRRTSIGLGKAKRIARTESRRIQNEAAYDAQLKAKENGADIVKQWNGILDGKIRPSHAELHGQVKALDEYFAVNGHKALYPMGFGIASEDINCRCTLLQRARWSLEDEGEGIIEVKNFTEFRAKWNGFTKEYNNYRLRLKDKFILEFGQYVKLRNSDDFHLLESYAQHIEKGRLSSFVSFDDFMAMSKKIDDEIVGMTAPNGIVISGKSDHFIARVFGSENEKRDGVSIEDIRTLLDNPNAEILPIRIDNGKPSQRIRKDGILISVNPDTGVLIQVNPEKTQ